jgi:hypothetical protein
LGAGGQALDDIYKYLPSDDRLSMARRTLEWRHIAPTAPDTLCEYKDPFIIERRPNVYFWGNQPEFRTALVGGELRGQSTSHIYHHADSGTTPRQNRTHLHGSSCYLASPRPDLLPSSTSPLATSNARRFRSEFPNGTRRPRSSCPRKRSRLNERGQPS